MVSQNRTNFSSIFLYFYIKSKKTTLILTIIFPKGGIIVKEDYYILIKNKLIDNEVYARVKDYSKESNKVITYFEIGKLLSEAGSRYGENIIKEYSKKLELDLGKKYNVKTLYKMRQFYYLFSDRNFSTVSRILSWSHYSELLSIKDKNEVEYYLNESLNNNYSIRQLREKIKSKEYYRLPKSTRNKLITNTKLELKDTIKDPIIINTNKDIINEKALQLVILEDISSFLKELGNGFTFVDNEYRIKIGDRYNYIDLLLFNYIYNCFVVVELKVTEYKKEYTGQIETYMNYCDKYLKNKNNNPTLGIVLVRKNNKFYVEYSSNENIIAREYILFK